MNIHEYQGKQIYARYGVPHPKGIPAFSAEEARQAAEKLIAETGNEVVVVKAQIHAGGRGKAGGVKVAKGAAAAEEKAKALLGTCRARAEIREVAQAPPGRKAEVVPPLWRPRTKDPG